MLLYVTVCCSVLRVLKCSAICCNVLQRVAACCSVLRCVAVCCSVLPRVAACCCVLQYVAVCCRQVEEAKLRQHAHAHAHTYTHIHTNPSIPGLESWNPNTPTAEHTLSLHTHINTHSLPNSPPTVGHT